MRLLLVGSGGREHALAWKLAQSPLLDELHAAPGNPGIASVGTCHPVRADDVEALLALAGSLAVDLVVVGPEGPLVAGLADALRHAGIAVFGPGAEAARIEGSKSFAKDVMAAVGVRPARVLERPTAPCVVKLDGLAAGKGVFVCHDEDELRRGLRAADALGGRIVAEELLEGEELSVFALVDGRDVLPLGSARDYSALEDGDVGPNTGGMGSYSPVADAPPLEEVVDEIHRPVVEELARRDTPFVGCLYAGLMLTQDGPRVLEFNCRFGDPETQVLLPRLDGDLLPALAAAVAGDLAGVGVGRSDAQQSRSRSPRASTRHTPTWVLRSTASLTPSRRAHSSSTPGRRCAAAASSRTAGAYSTSPEWASRSATPESAHTRVRSGSRSWGRATARTSPHSLRRSMADVLVGVVVGAESDRERIQPALDELDARGLAWELEVRSAHRTPDAVAEYGRTARERGLRVLIAGAGLAAALPGVLAAHTDLPVIGVPLRSSLSVLDGLDALLAIAQMPPGVPVATVGVDNARNAALLAARILDA